MAIASGASAVMWFNVLCRYKNEFDTMYIKCIPFLHEFFPHQLNFKYAALMR